MIFGLFKLNLDRTRLELNVPKLVVAKITVQTPRFAEPNYTL